MNDELTVQQKRLRLVGAVIQGVIIGVLLLDAVLMLLQVDTGVRLFRYQGF